MKQTGSWYSERLEQPIGLARWGHYGTPVLVFPTAGGDAEEIERNGLVDACLPLIEAGRIKIYSCDSVAGRAMVAETGSPEYRMWLADQYHHCVRHEVVPAIRSDLGGSEVPIVTAGASIGAFNAVAVLCRFPDVFGAAVGMSGTYRLQRFFDGRSSPELDAASPVVFLPGLDGDRLAVLRTRFAIIASGQGAHEDLGESWAVGHALGRMGVPNRVDPWGEEWPHEWPTWRRMLPQYLDEVLAHSA
ncbi:esterase family protein [Geodermatophilus sp. SYSU D00703]